MRKRTWARVAAALWTACIVIATVGRGSQTGRHLATEGLYHDATHLATFGLLGSLLVLSTGSARSRCIALFAATLLGLSTEIYEHVVFHGPMEYRDALTDACGVLLGGLLLWMATKQSADEGRTEDRPVGP